ncbi:DMT family transporter [Photobacterium sanguinicancri]|uniref:DMT family transporter n=1 Tax=Photobacterium sanguinicancri TaxID=875932 RepID=UPI0026E465D5|nr:DMT family transporter [Photobacterium sanguinicancri]MDO6500784.1 DMT family transporter [Photobacterium sanguinicancri]
MTLERRAEFLLLFTTFCASAGWIFSKEVIQGMPPFGFMGLRFLAASLILLPFCLKHFKVVAIGDVLRSMSVGCLLGGALLCWIYAISISDTLGEGAFIMSLSVLLAPLVAWVLFKHKPVREFWLSLPFAIVGLMLLSLSQGWQGSISQLWFLLAAFFLALHFNFNSRFAQRMPVMLLTCIQLFVTGVLGLILSLSVETWPATIPSVIWGWFALSVLFATSLRYLTQTMGQQRVTAANAAIIMILEPIWTVLLSILWYKEAMPAAKVIGCTMILFSLLLYRGLSNPKIRAFLKRSDPHSS